MKIILALLFTLNCFAGYVEIPPPSGGGGGTITDVNGYVGPSVTLGKSDIGLGNADNTSDANKPISSAQQTALNLKANSASVSAIGFSGDANDLSTIVPIAKGGTNNSSAYTAGSVTFSSGSAITQDNTNLFFNDTLNFLKVHNTIELGSTDPFARSQIWNYGTNASMRLGALGQDGDFGDVSSEGIVAYGANSQGTAINSGTGDFGYARIKADRFGLYTSIANTAFYYFRIDPTEFYLKSDANVKTFQVTRSSGQIDTSMGAGIVHSDASGILSSSALTPSDVTGGAINTFAGFDASGTLYSVPTYNFIPYINGLASSMTTDGSSQANVEKLYFGTTLGNGTTGDIDNYTDLYFSNITNANFAIDYYRSYASYFNGANGTTTGSVSLVDIGYDGTVTNDVKSFSSYYNGNNGGNTYGLVYSRNGITTGDSSGASLSTTGQAVNIYGYRNNIGGIATNQVEQVSLFNNATVGGNYFGVNDNNQGNVTGQIYHFNSSNQGNANSYTGSNVTNSGVMSNYATGYNFYNQGVAPSLTYFNAGNDANISGNITGINLTNSGTSTNHTGLALSNGVSGSAVTYQGLSISNQADISGSSTIANIFNDGDGVQTTGLNVNIQGNHTTSIVGASISVNNATHPNTIQPVGLQVNGALNVSSTLTTGIDPVGVSSSLNSVGGNFTIASGSALSGGEFAFGNNLAPVMNFNDDMGEDMTGLDLGFSAVGFVGSLNVTGGAIVADLNMALAGAGNPSGSGVVDNMTMYYAAGILPQGGSVTANNMYAFKTSTVLCGVATNCWGINVQDTSAENFLPRLAINTTSKKVSSSDVGLEIGKKALVLGKNTSVELAAMGVTKGAIAYNESTDKLALYNGAWVDLDIGGGGGITTLNTLTNSTIDITAASSGTDFNITTSAGIINLNLPTASASNTGKLSSSDFIEFTKTIPLNSSSLALAGASSVSISLVKYKQKWIVESSGGAVTLSTTPFGSSAPLDGAQITLIGNSDTNSITITNNDIAKGCILNGDATLLNGQSIVVEYDATKDRYFQIGKNF